MEWLAEVDPLELPYRRMASSLNSTLARFIGRQWNSSPDGYAPWMQHGGQTSAQCCFSHNRAQAHADGQLTNVPFTHDLTRPRWRSRRDKSSSCDALHLDNVVMPLLLKPTIPSTRGSERPTDLPACLGDAVLANFQDVGPQVLVVTPYTSLFPSNCDEELLCSIVPCDHALL